MIAAVTPEIKGTNQISRLNILPADIAAIGRVPVQFHRDESLGMARVTYEKLRQFMSNNPTANFDVLWKCSVMFGSPRPAWSGTCNLYIMATTLVSHQ